VANDELQKPRRTAWKTNYSQRVQTQLNPAPKPQSTPIGIGSQFSVQTIILGVALNARHVLAVCNLQPVQSVIFNNSNNNNTTVTIIMPNL